MPLSIAFGIAALLHVVAVVAFAPALSRDAAGADSPHATLQPDAILPPEHEPRELDLGIDAQTPASLTWIGYDSYLEHLARLSAVEQAQFEDDPGLMAGTDQPLSEPDTAGPSDATLTQAAPTETTADAGDPANATVPVDDPGPPPPPVIVDESNQTPTPTEALVDHEAPPGVGVDDDAPSSLTGPAAPAADAEEGTMVRSASADEIEAIAAGVLPGMVQISPRPRPISESVQDPPDPADRAERTAAERAEQAPQPNVESPTAPPSPPPGGEADRAAASPSPRQPTESAGAARDGSGAESDRESVATSTVEVPLAALRAARPVAAHGMEIQTRNPVFPVLTSVTAAPRNPLVEIQFGGNGRPRHARLLESSGDSRVDGPIVDSLYRWRARGGALESLDREDPTATVAVRMRILLTSR